MDARYVRMFGIELGWWFGYSLWSFDVLSGTQPSEGLSDVHFIRLTLKDKAGNVVSENNYWRGNDRLNFTALNTLPKADLKVSSKMVKKMERQKSRLPSPTPLLPKVLPLPCMCKHTAPRMVSAFCRLS